MAPGWLDFEHVEERPPATPSGRILMEMLGGDPDDPSSFNQSDVPAEAWYDAEKGLRVIRAMLAYVRDDGRQIDNVDCVREDLEAFEKCLADAARRGTRWHLVIDA